MNQNDPTRQRHDTHHDNSAKPNQKISKAFWIKLALVPVGMFGFAFALVPLYDVLCDATGLNGRTANTAYEGLLDSKVDKNHKITVDFVSMTAPGFPVEFHPKQRKIDIIPGKIYTIFYTAENRSDKVIVGQAIPSIAPFQATQHFKKLACFCFSNQTFQPKIPVDMPVTFFVDSKLDKDVKNITLSYNFFKIKKTDQSKASVAGL